MSREKTRTSATQKLIDKNLRNVRTTTVGKVLKILANGWLEIDPQISLVQRNPDTGEETEVSLTRLVRVPVGYYKAGGFVMTLPTSVGDEGLLFFSDRSLDLWKKTGKKATPNSPRLHDYSDAIFVPFPTSEGGAIQFDTDKMVIGKEDGSSTIKIAKVGSAITMDTTLITMNANLQVNGTIDATGVITAPDHDVPGEPSYVDHKHDGVTTGVGTSGGIVP